MVLHGVAVGLALPTLKISAVVGANTFPTHAEDCVAFGGVVKSEVLGTPWSLIALQHSGSRNLITWIGSVPCPHEAILFYSTLLY